MSTVDTVPLNAFESQGVVMELIFRLKVRDVMSRKLVTAGPDDTLRSIQILMSKNRVSGIPIVDGDAMLGIISLYDIIVALDVGYIQETAEKRMTKSVTVLQEDMPLSFAIQYFNSYHFGRFPVLDKDSRLVGILTPSDILKALLVQMNHELRKLEIVAKPGEGPDSAMRRASFSVSRYDFENAGKASQAIKDMILEAGVDPQIARRAAIASYELELNQVIHSDGGILSAAVGQGRIEIMATDKGPGIPDIDQAMKEGFSTAIDWVRSLGFGAGMGLPNAKRASDHFSIESALGRGTTVSVIIECGKEA